MFDVLETHVKVNVILGSVKTFETTNRNEVLAFQLNAFDLKM